MPCDAVVDFITRETGRYMVPILERRTFPRSIWMTLVRRGAFPNGMGETINTLIYERSAPTDAEPTWSNVSTVDGAEGGSCLPPATVVNIASTARSFSLARRVLQGPDICNVDILSAFDLQNQLKSVGGILGDYAKIEWEIRDRHEYFRLCQTKVVVDDCTNPTESTTMASTYPAACPTMPLSMSVLRKYSIYLMRDGAGADALLRMNGAPVGTCIVSNETAGNIIRQNFQDREDIRFSNQANILVQAFGISHSYAGIAFLIDPFPRRFSCAGGIYTEIPAFSLTAATKGQKAIINPTWRTAPEEESFWFDPMVFTQLIPEPPVAPYPNFQFDPVNYTGIVTLKNIPDRVCNPDGNIIFHRMHLAAASMPVEPERGVAFVHDRCEPEGCVVVCAS